MHFRISYATIIVTEVIDQYNDILYYSISLVLLILWKYMGSIETTRLVSGFHIHFN